ncbi:30S ribosomal protein S6, partial [Patescibacteria group bacterium]|nr:30S ribosomal protein S6 [Patescibacteria group bacterium]
MTKEKPSEMEEQNKYETMVILDPNLGAEETAKKVQEIKDLIVSSGGEVTHEDDWGARDLAYKLRGNKEGYYYVLNFTLDPSKIKKLVKHMKLEKHALRSLIIKLDAHYRVKTLKQYEEEAVVAEAEEKKKKEEEEKEKGRPKERKTPQPKKIKKPVVEEPKEEEK